MREDNDQEVMPAAEAPEHIGTLPIFALNRFLLSRYFSTDGNVIVPKSDVLESYGGLNHLAMEPDSGAADNSQAQ